MAVASFESWRAGGDKKIPKRPFRPVRFSPHESGQPFEPAVVLETTGPLWLLLTVDPSTSGCSPSGAPQRPPAKTRTWLTQPPAGLDSASSQWKQGRWGKRWSRPGDGFWGILVSTFLILPDRSWMSSMMYRVQSISRLNIGGVPDNSNKTSDKATQTPLTHS